MIKEIFVGAGLAIVLFVLEIIRNYFINRHLDKQEVLYDGYNLNTYSFISLLVLGFAGAGFIILKSTVDMHIAWSIFLPAVTMLFSFLFVSQKFKVN